ncbi:MAG: AAA family ATPase [Synergistaceae bacterium]|nr:AAA family ATPase [Synergistaceae bacterium]
MAYMTGILPIKKYGEHSALNMFDEYSMLAPMQLAEYTGFTESEVTYLCQEYARDFAKIKYWYDGYEVSGIIPKKSNGSATRYSIYNPLSVAKAVSTGIIANYWTKTETKHYQNTSRKTTMA